MRRLVACLTIVSLAAGHGAGAAEGVRVYAAASLTNALNDIAAAWAKEGHPQPKLVLAASSTLARQIEAGAPADIFASADLEWMDYLDERHEVVTASRRNLLGNMLVLIVPQGKRFDVKLESGFAIEHAFSTKLCMGEPASVPAGIYGKQALTSLGWWSRLQSRVVGTDDVRTALAFVERGECALGIVYETDAKISDRVEVLAAFPETSHDPIVYPFALLEGHGPEAPAFLDYLASAPAQAVFEKYGFQPLKH
jgi:molybdate transport system substrate-binding protein